MAKRITKVTTKTGDDGSTGMADGSRVKKSSDLINAIGEIDELNSWIGLLTSLPELSINKAVMVKIQNCLFDIGGSIHIITNNQVGFTTNSIDGRSFDHSSDIVKSFGIPVIRINAADGGTTPESLIKVCKLMVSYWKTFKKDILIDMIGCRKHGHNEVDEPSFT